MPLVTQFDHGVEDRSLNPSLAQKIAEAERPHVPPTTVRDEEFCARNYQQFAGAFMGAKSE